MKSPRLFRDHKWPIIAFLCLLTAILGFLYGNGILNRPKIKISAVAIDLRLPEEIQADFFFQRMMLFAESMEKEALLGLEENLRKLNFPEEKLKKISEFIDAEYKSESIKPNVSTNAVIQKTNLTVSEQRMLATAIMNLKTMEKAFLKGFLPTRIMRFEIVNSGNRDAEEVIVKTSVPGIMMYDEVDCDNHFIKQIKDNILEISMQKLSPKTKVKGAVWYDSFASGKNKQLKIITIYKNGKQEIEFNEDDFLNKLVP